MEVTVGDIIRLVTINGIIIELEIPKETSDEIFDEISVAFAGQGLFNAENWGIKANYMGQELGKIDFHKIIGMS